MTMRLHPAHNCNCNACRAEGIRRLGNAVGRWVARIIIGLFVLTYIASMMPLSWWHR